MVMATEKKTMRSQTSWSGRIQTEMKLAITAMISIRPHSGKTPMAMDTVTMKTVEMRMISPATLQSIWTVTETVLVTIPICSPTTRRKLLTLILTVMGTTKMHSNDPSQWKDSVDGYGDEYYFTVAADGSHMKPWRPVPRDPTNGVTPI